MFRNPYNFAEIDEGNVKSERKSGARFGGLSGVLTVRITFKTEAIVSDGKDKFMKVGDKIGIYGSTLKGLLRATAEAISNSCISMISDKYSYRKDTFISNWPSPSSNVTYEHFTKKAKNHIKFDHKQLINLDVRIDSCNHEKGLCIACRIFGTTGKKISEEKTFNFAGKLKVMDAGCRSAQTKKKYIGARALGTPQNHHEPFYLDGKKIKGRKFYYHHEKANVDKGDRELEVVAEGSVFEFDIHYNSLSPEELGLLLQTIELEAGLGHKLGMGKPLGLGSCVMEIVKLKEINPKDRYSSLGNVLEFTDIALGGKLDDLKSEYKGGKALDAVPQLKDILTLHTNRAPSDKIEIRYPDYNWFHPGGGKANNTPLLKNGLLSEKASAAPPSPQGPSQQKARGQRSDGNESHASDRPHRSSGVTLGEVARITKKRDKGKK